MAKEKRKKSGRQQREKPPEGYTPEAWAEYQNDPVTFCIKELKNPDSDVRFNAADILRGLAGEAEAAIPALVEGFRDKDRQVRAQCVFALVDIGWALKERASGAVPALAEALRDPDDEVRSLAANALGAIGPAASAAAPRLRKALKDSAEEVREAAKEALSKVAPSA
jgi:HEAT repeat protein